MKLLSGLFAFAACAFIFFSFPFVSNAWLNPFILTVILLSMLSAAFAILHRLGRIAEALEAKRPTAGPQKPDSESVAKADESPAVPDQSKAVCVDDPTPVAPVAVLPESPLASNPVDVTPEAGAPTATQRPPTRRIVKGP
jgi:hypothetical protein